MINFKTLRGRLAFFFTLTVIVSLILSAVTATGLLRLYIYQTTLSELNRQADVIAAQTQRQDIMPARLLRVAESILQTKILFARAPMSNDMPPMRGMPQMPQMMAGSEFPQETIDWPFMASGRRQVINGRLPRSDTEAILVAQPVFVRGSLMGAVVIGRPLRQYQEAWLPIVIRLTLAGGGALIISLLLVYYLSRYLTDPLRDMTLSAKAIAGGDFKRKVNVETEDELGELASSLNEMADKVAESIRLRQNFVMNVSHELRTPLTSIQGFSEALIDKAVTSPGERARSLNIIHREALHLGRLINDLLDLAKLDAKQFSLNKQEVDLMSLLDDCRNIYVERAGDTGVDFHVNAAELPLLKSDGDRIRQVILNLLDNAFKFTPTGGSIYLTAKAAGNMVIIEVRDSGPGINPEDLPHIFKPFYSSKKSQGSGLGLAIARELSRALNGDLTVTDNAGRGTTFSLFLPYGEDIA